MARAPVLAAGGPVDGALTVSWASFPGLTYQVQYKTNLAQAGWINLGNPVVASNSVMSASVPIGPDPQRFYRLFGPQ